MEGRAYSEFYRNTSEEIFIKTMMESSMGMPAPTMEMLGFKNFSQNCRTDSEELFRSWLTNGENNGSHSTSNGHRGRQASRRISTELTGLTNQHGLNQKKQTDDISLPQTSSIADDSLNDLSSVWNGVDKGLQGSNLFLAKAWFQSTQPMTRSRSSELRRRYAAMQTSQSVLGMEAMHDMSGYGVNNLKQEQTDANALTSIKINEIPNQISAFMSPSNSSSSNFNNPQLGTVDKISSVVSMLKGTIERKKLSNQIEKETVGDSSFGYYTTEEVLGNICSNQGQGIHTYETQGAFHDPSTFEVKDNGVFQTTDNSIGINMDSVMAPMNPILISREPSQSESSAAAPVFSNGFNVGDDPCITAQAPSVSESSMKQWTNKRSPEDCSKIKDIRERIYDNLKDDQKKGGLIRFGSVSSAGSADKGDPTKKRRVERSRKMAEAKERSSTPSVPADMRALLKRCENLEKEVRSLKLNLSFMNRKDSEQTKQIEELQKQNQELTEEKERLLEEIERILVETGKL